MRRAYGPIVKWYYAAFALRRREFDSPWVHKVNGIESGGRIRIAEAGVRFSLGPRFVMKLYITTNFQEGNNRKEIEELCGLMAQAGFEDFCFIRDVENYKKKFNNPYDLMRRAKDEIEKSDALLIDMTMKPTGRAVEAGIAFALNKKVVVIAKRGTLIKDTIRGIADRVIEYDTISDVVSSLREWLSEMK